MVTFLHYFFEKGFLISELLLELFLRQQVYSAATVVKANTSFSSSSNTVATAVAVIAVYS